VQKRILILLLTGLLAICIVGCKSSSKWDDGVVYGTGDGHNGPIKAEVTVEKGKITKVEAIEHEETPGIGDTAIEKISDQVIDSQSSDVDTVSGATMTSEGFIKAIDEALAQVAKG